MKKYTYLLVGLALMAVACKAPRMDYTPDIYEGDMISFGNGGGFTGKVDRYVLLDNGQLFNQEAMIKTDVYKALAPLDKRLTEQLFANFYSLDLHKMIVRDPGDLYYFIDMRKDGKEHRLMWGGHEQTPHPNVKKYYMNLFQLAQRQRTKPVTR